MATFQVPQFIDEKPKIVGPLTLQQFLYIAGGAGIAILAFNIFNFFIFLFIAIIVFVAAFALAFIKVNGQNLPGIALAGFRYFWTPRVYTWKRADKDIDVSDIERIQAVRNSMSIQEKIKSMTMGIATGNIFKGKREPSSERYQVVRRITGEKIVAKRIDY